MLVRLEPRNFTAQEGIQELTECAREIEARLHERIARGKALSASERADFESTLKSLEMSLELVAQLARFVETCAAELANRNAGGAAGARMER